jgi:hypothetical protein
MVPRPKFQAGCNPVSIIAGNLDLAHRQKILSFMGPMRISEDVIKEILVRHQLAYTTWSDAHLTHCPCCTNSWFEEIVGADSLLYQHIYDEGDDDIPEELEDWSQLDLDHEWFDAWCIYREIQNGVVAELRHKFALGIPETREAKRCHFEGTYDDDGKLRCERSLIELNLDSKGYKELVELCRQLKISVKLPRTIKKKNEAMRDAIRNEYYLNL